MTEIIRSIAEIRAIRENLVKADKIVGLVPTMGYLHAGHQSLIETAKKQCDFVIVSDFLNPLQFGPSEDLSKYPRDLEKDLIAVDQMGADILFYPSATEIYGEDFLKGGKILTTVIPPENLTNKLCGLKRPGHFEGVCTVVAKLFNITQPHYAYFGQKDAQQLVIIKKMVKDLNRDVKVVGCPIVREKDGLAMSSRNIYLTQKERNAALILNQSLQNARDYYLQEASNKTVNSQDIIKIVEKSIKTQELAKIDYISLVDPFTLEDKTTLDIAHEYLLAIAVFIGEDVHKTRLIDNIILKH